MVVAGVDEVNAPRPVAADAVGDSLASRRAENTVGTTDVGAVDVDKVGIVGKLLHIVSS